MTDPDRDGRLRLTIIGGFLGSGKTTWLRHQMFERRFDAAHVIVNEAAGTPVDDSLLSEAQALTVLAGGCACCEGATAFQDALLAICDTRSQIADPAARLDHILLETSGLADPGAIVALIQDHPILIRHIVVAQVFVVVDAVYGRDALDSQPLARAQVRSADHLVLTKTDVATPADMTRLRHVLRLLAPVANQTGATFGSPVPLPDLGPAHVDDVLAPLKMTEPAIVACQLDLGPAPDWTALTLWLSALLHARGNQIVRVKGVIASPAGRLLVQAVRNTVQRPEVLPRSTPATGADNTLVLIGSGISQSSVSRSYQITAGAGPHSVA